MGIDNDAKLFFGYRIDWDNLQKIQDELGEEDLLDKLWSDQESLFDKEFPDLYLGYASPYYDCDCVNLNFYIAIRPLVGTSCTIDELKELIKNWENNTSYRRCLEKFGFEFQEPMIIACPHVY